MEGMQEGTLFDKDVVEAMEEAASRAASTVGSEDGGEPSDSGRDMAVAARTASRKVQSLPTEVRNRIKMGQGSELSHTLLRRHWTGHHLAALIALTCLRTVEVRACGRLRFASSETHDVL